MLTKLGDAFVDLHEIALAVPVDAGEPTVEIVLRSGCSCYVKCEPEELEIRLHAAGLFCHPEDDLEAPELTDDELAKLRDLEADGYRYMARDKDGKLFAFRQKPEYDGAYWNDPGPQNAGVFRIYGGFNFIEKDADEPAEIYTLMGFPF